MTTLALVGPTGVGKTAVALALADRGVEVLSMDSVQVYRGMDIGSAKPTLVERARVRHHLVDLVAPDARYSAADWLADAERAELDIVARGRQPFLVGGTGLYLRLWLEGLAPLPSADEPLRTRLREEEAIRPGVLHEKLRALDPETAARLAPRDLVRVVRALEVHALTGTPLSTHLRAHAVDRDKATLPIFVLDPPDDVLREALTTRARHMLEEGLVEEARALRIEYGDARPLGAVGYKEALEHLDGKIAAADLVERIVTSTWQFARRQRTWFHKAPGAQRFSDVASVETAIARILGSGHGQAVSAH